MYVYNLVISLYIIDPPEHSLTYNDQLVSEPKYWAISIDHICLELEYKMCFKYGVEIMLNELTDPVEQCQNEKMEWSDCV